MDDFIGNQEKKSWHVTRAPRESKRKEQMAENIKSYFTDLTLRLPTKRPPATVFCLSYLE